MDFLLQTPTVHYCEMALNAIIARPWYALSNIAFLIVGVLFWLSDTTQLYCADIGLLNGRAIFHYTNAASIYLLFRFYTQHTSRVD